MLVAMKRYKKTRLRKLVGWEYITQEQANQMWREYLKLFKGMIKS